MGRPVHLAVGFAATLVLAAAGDILAHLQMDRSRFEEACFQFVAHPDRLPQPVVTPAMRALAVVQRKAAVESLLGSMKVYYASPAFQKRWAEHRAPFDRDEANAQQRSQHEAAGRAQMGTAIAQMEQMLPMLPPAQQAEMKKAIAKAKEEKSNPGKASRGPKESGPPKDPKVALRQALQNVLAKTEGVDYGAALSEQGGKRYFSRPDYESKPDAWKMAFRAGREASEGGRNYIRAWLAELGGSRR